jgi:DTW domain-containing protein
MEEQIKKIDKKEACPVCFRPKAQCFCAAVLSRKTGLSVLILQHPQERYKLLNSAALAHAMLEGSRLKVGLSWRNLSHALGGQVDSKEWAVLFLKPQGGSEKPVELFDGKKRPVPSFSALKGLVVIDGSWKQAKSLWWRNPWLLRLNRIALYPERASLRPQAKREGLSTIEAIALSLQYLSPDPETSAALMKSYEELIIAPNR